VADTDGDRDGVYDSTDECPATKAGVAVDELGCALFSGVLDGINFESGSDVLTSASVSRLNEVVQTLKRFPSLTFLVSAHTDSQGSETSNMELSRKRARSVVFFLERAGITGGRFKAKAFGETKPIASNETAEGRLQNRRVELTALR